ncbi:MAG: ATP-dependent Clp protease ATP-binding subunit [Candidatus Eremiobacteraeota bacterium]|nr:ATP-dependent Clp protease ATP-binding subunit [Candidatus Eremiobacteraeota bacterium]
MSVPFDEFMTRALERAQEKSREVQNGYVGTEHLLWGIIEEKGDLAAILQEHSVNVEELLKHLDTAMRDYEGLSKEQGPRTPRMRKVLAAAHQLALQLMESRVTERLILQAILQGGTGTAVRVLDTFFPNSSDLLGFIEAQSRKSLKQKAQWLVPDKMPYLGAPIPRQFLTPAGMPIAPPQNVEMPLKMAPPPPMRGDPYPEAVGPFGRDLSGLAVARKIGPVFGRDKDIEALCLCLRRATSNNPVLVGESGIGKTAVAEGLALFVTSADAPDFLRSTKILEVSRGRFLQALSASKEAEGKFKDFVQHSTYPGAILVLDGILEILDEERIPWAVVNSLNYLKEMMEERKVRVLITTGPRTYEKRIAADAVFSKHCQRFDLKELSPADAEKALASAGAHFARHHQVAVAEALYPVVVEMAVEYIKDGFLPGKVLDILDEACAIAGLKKASRGAAELAEEDLFHAISKRSGLPFEKVSRKAEKFRTMEEEIRKRIIGQDDAVAVVCDRIKLFMTGLHEGDRPLGVLFFAGPTGVGKTELARVIASYLFGTDDHFYRFDMSEYSQAHEVSRLVGAPPGYIGFDEEGQLTGKIKRDPYSVVLLDEMEKAHPRIFDIFLQVFDAGRLTDARGNTADFRNVLIIMTSNLGSELWDEGRSLGFRQKEAESPDRKEKLMEILKERFSPEFINRLHEIVLFRAISRDDIRAIAALIIGEWKEKSKRLGITLEVKESLLEHLCDAGYSARFGVRNLKRTIENELIVPLSKKVLEEQVPQGTLVNADYKDGCLVLEREGSQ